MGAGKVSAREGSRWLGLTIKRVRDLTDPQSDGLDRFLARSNGSRLSGRRGTTVYPVLVHESYIECWAPRMPLYCCLYCYNISSLCFEY